MGARASVCHSFGVGTIQLVGNGCHCHAAADEFARNHAQEAKEIIVLALENRAQYVTKGLPDAAAAKTNGTIKRLAAGHLSQEMLAEALLSTHAAALFAFKNLEKNVRQISRADARVRLLMSTPGVGPLVALTYVSAIDDPKHFTSSKRAGAHFGLTPKKYQSGETDISGRISKIGDSSVRAVLYEAAISS